MEATWRWHGGETPTSRRVWSANPLACRDDDFRPAHAADVAAALRARSAGETRSCTSLGVVADQVVTVGPRYGYPVQP